VGGGGGGGGGGEGPWGWGGRTTEAQKQSHWVIIERRTRRTAVTHSPSQLASSLILSLLGFFSSTISTKAAPAMALRGLWYLVAMRRGCCKATSAVALLGSCTGGCMASAWSRHAPALMSYVQPGTASQGALVMRRKHMEESHGRGLHVRLGRWAWHRSTGQAATPKRLHGSLSLESSG